MVNILAIGDPHGNLDKIKEIPISQSDTDLILLTGDLGKADLMRNMFFENVRRKNEGLPEKEYTPRQKKRAFMEAHTSTLRVVNYLRKFAPVYTIFGNVETSPAETRKYASELGLELPVLSNALNELDNVRVINNRIANFDGVRIGGLDYFTDTNWVRDFKPSDYRKRMKSAKKGSDKAKRALKWFGDSLDILVCHQPPYGYLDQVTAKFAPKDWQGKHAGSKPILDYIERRQPGYVFCGHIHEGEGSAKIGNTEVHNLGVCGYTRVVI